MSADISAISRLKIPNGKGLCQMGCADAGN